MAEQGMHKAYFHFAGSMCVFLPKRSAGASYTFRGAPAIKDAIEAQGVPHPEVDVILVNQKPVSFSYQLQPEDRVEVYPYERSNVWPAGYSMEEKLPPPQRFILDVHLGTLAKSMRMLGLDASYQTDLTDSAIAALAAGQRRVVLTRDVGLLKQKSINWGYWLRSQHTEEQLLEVLRRYNLNAHIKPLTRCLACNSRISKVEKEQVLELLPPKTRLYFNEFYQCPGCQRVYWKGSHYERMVQYISKFNNLK